MTPSLVGFHGVGKSLEVASCHNRFWLKTIGGGGEHLILAVRKVSQNRAIDGPPIGKHQLGSAIKLHLQRYGLPQMHFWAISWNYAYEIVALNRILSFNTRDSNGVIWRPE
jgi:hypothetical protein